MASPASSASLLTRIKATVRRAPGVDALVTASQRRHFLSPAGLTSHWGVYGGFDEARANLPPSRGYDSSAAVEDVQRRGVRLYPYDYPVLFWLSRAFAQGAHRIYDIGGAIGSHFYIYRGVLPFPDGVEWLVCELPAAVAAGRRLAEERGAAAQGLRFTETAGTLDIQADVWISAGALQYIEDADLARGLKAAREAPRFIILNKLPLYSGDEFVVTQNIAPDCFSPSWVWNRKRFIERIEVAGYRLIDEWKVLERDLYVPGHPERSFAHFSGLCFERREN